MGLPGKIVAGNNTTPIGRALVFISTSSKLYSTYTNNDGTFSLEAAEGVQELHIQTGSGTMFRTNTSVTIQSGQTTSLPSPLRLNQVATLAYYPGDYDKIESILIDSLGYTATRLNPGELQSLSVLSNYNAVFIDCGEHEVFVNAGTDEALGNYVAGGGSLYISDLSLNFLIGINNFGGCGTQRQYGFIPDSTMCSTAVGTQMTINDANIVSPELQYYLGANTMDISYDLDAWEVVQSADNSFWQVMITNPVNNAPLFMRTNRYTNNNNPPNFTVGTRDTGFVTICHQMTGGTAPITITVSTSELASHLAHGDSEGPCDNNNKSGWIYYTTFHNEHNGMISSEVKRIMEFTILNL